MLYKYRSNSKRYFSFIFTKRKSEINVQIIHLKFISKATLELISNYRIWSLLFLTFVINPVFSSHQGKDSALTVRSKIFQKLSEAQALIESGKYLESKVLMDDLYKSRERYPLNALELAYAYYFYGFYYYVKENYKKSIECYKKVLAIKEISDSMKSQSLYTLGQLEFSLENFRESLEYLLAWLSMSRVPSSDAYILIGQVYYKIKNYNKAISFVEQGIDLSNKRNKKPKESWLKLLTVLFYEIRDIKKTTEVYKKLLAHYPKKQYFMQLSSMYGELKQPHSQLSVMQAAYRAKMLNKESELVNYAYMMMALELPSQAAEVIKKGIDSNLIKANKKNLVTLGNIYYQANDFKKAIPYLREAASLSDENDIWMTLASSFLRLEQFSDAKEAAQSALTKKNLKNPGMNYILLGYALLHLKRFEDAEEAFGKAAQFEKTRMHGIRWLNYVQSEKKNYETLKIWLGP